MSGLATIWKNLVGKKSGPVVEMAAGDREVIVAFARGADELRKQAISIHRKYIPMFGSRGNALQRFMAEVDNPCPDAYLRRVYRDEVVEAYAA